MGRDPQPFCHPEGQLGVVALSFFSGTGVGLPSIAEDGPHRLLLGEDPLVVGNTGCFDLIGGKNACPNRIALGNDQSQIRSS
jgi:hypothetical protein